MATTVTNTNGKRTMSEQEQEETPVVAKCAKTGPTLIEELEQVISIINNAPDLNDQEKRDAIEKIREFDVEYAAMFRNMALFGIRSVARHWMSLIKPQGYRTPRFFTGHRFDEALWCQFEHEWAHFEAGITNDRLLSQDEKDHHKARHQTYFDNIMNRRN